MIRWMTTVMRLAWMKLQRQPLHAQQRFVLDQIRKAYGTTGERCGWWVGPIWKLGGETCVCDLPAGHEMPHKCPCGSWFEGCGHPPREVTALS